MSTDKKFNREYTIQRLHIPSTVLCERNDLEVVHETLIKTEKPFHPEYFLKYILIPFKLCNILTIIELKQNKRKILPRKLTSI